MSLLPKPPSSVDGSCTIIQDGTLYAYTHDAFLSLNLKEGAEWETLKNGEQVTGAVCVGSSDGLFVVGGTGGSDDYSGLQKFSYSSREWNTIPLSNPITKNLQGHGSTYIKANDAILLYAGSRDGSKAPSSDTWTIKASEPYTVDAFSTGSHPSVDPILLNLSDADACLIGGDTGNTAVAVFNPTTGWREVGISLSAPLSKERGQIQAAIATGSDNSKSLYTFDLSSSPSQVTRFLLQNENGDPISNSPPLSKRDLSVNDWPEYNSTFAPESTRSNFAIATGDDGMVVFTGGNAQEPISIFNVNKNAWVDADGVFVDKDQDVLADKQHTTSGSSSTATAKSSSSSETSTSLGSASSTFSTASATTGSLSESITASISATSGADEAAASTDAAAIAPGGGSSNSSIGSNAILGITLGTILGFMAILGILLLLLRRRRSRSKQVEAAEPRSASGGGGSFFDGEKDPSAFGLGPKGPDRGHFRGHNPKMSQESYSSMAILMGRAGKQKNGLSRKPSNDTFRSSVSSLHKQLKATIGKPILQNQQHPTMQPREDKGVVAFDPNVVEPRPRQNRPETEDGLRRSSGWNRYWSGGSALQILGFGGQSRTTLVSERSSRYSEAPVRNNARVTQDSATVPPLNFDFRPEMNRVNSGSPVVAESPHQIPFKDGMVGKIERPPSSASSGYSSGVPESVHDSWPQPQNGKTWGADRAPRSAYNPSFYYATPLSPSTSPRNPPTGVSTQPQLAMASTSSDMSWLNLGERPRH